MDDMDRDSDFAEFFDDTLYASDDEVRSTGSYHNTMTAEHVIQGESKAKAAREVSNGSTKHPSTTYNPTRSDRLMARRREYAKRLRIDTINTLQEISRIAFFDIRNLFDDDGKLIPIPRLDEETAAAIKSVKVQQLGQADGFATVVEYKLHDKLKALEQLGKNLGLFRDVNLNMQINGNVELNPMSNHDKARKIAFMLTQAMQAMKNEKVVSTQ